MRKRGSEKQMALNSKIENFSESILNNILERISNYKNMCDINDGVPADEVESKNKMIEQQLFLEIPDDYKLLLQRSNGIYFGNGIKFLNVDEILEETSIFKDMMEDWEIGRILHPFLEIVRYHDGNGFVFWYSEVNKYVVVDYVSDYMLDNIDSLKTFDNICEVIEYLEIEFKEYFKI